VLAGWNQPVAPGVVLGGEIQASLATDFAGSSYLRAMALARLGFAAGDNTLFYLLGGAGRMGEGWAFEAGMGAEIMVTDAMALRLEAAGIGQLGPVPNGNDIPAISALRITSGAIWQLDGGPAKTGFGSGPATTFSGPYAGIQIGSLADPRFGFFDDYGWGWHMSRFEFGALAGYNQALGEHIRVGVEAQAGVNFDTSGDAGLDLLALARIGLVPMDGLLAYAAGGVGMVEGRGAYAAGGGLEYGLWGNAALRGEALVLGRLDGMPGRVPTGRPLTTKVTIGTVWHFD
jgi:opacity protein-like surface antigen